MKKILILILCLFPIVSVNAEEKKLSCKPTSTENLLILNDISSFYCENILGDKLTFTNNGNDLSKYFEHSKVNEGVSLITIKDKNLIFDTNLEYGIVVISDGKNSYSLYVKNEAYIKPTENTTTVNSTEVTYNVILDNKGSKETKTCNAKKDGETCYITLPKLEDTNFNGWGTSNSCKDGSVGSTKVNKDITYYACYKDNELVSKKELYLKELSITDSNNEKIDFGTFSIKKRDYNFKVLNEVENLLIDAKSDEGIKLEYSGNEELKVGENEVIITLTDESNNKSEYKLVVTRLNEGETISNINYLSALVIGNYDIKFNKDIFNYTVTIDKDIDKLEINAVPLEKEDVVEIIDNNDLKNASIISINVLDGSDNITTYKINIIKESNNTLLLLGIAIIVLLILILIILIIIKRNRKKKLEKSKENNSQPETINNIEVMKF